MTKILLCCCLCMPLRHISLTSGYGYRIHPITGKYVFHAGIDLRARSDTVFAVMDGTILKAGYNPLLGIYMMMADSPWRITYGHLSQIFVLPGDSVKSAMPLGITGATGRVTGEHLHFSTSYRGQPFDPLRLLNLIIKKQ